MPASKDVPEAQKVYFDDGLVTLSDYNDAFSRFEQCAKDRGGSVVEVGRDAVTGVIEYQTAGPLLGPGQTNGTTENDCYQKFFVQTEIAFELTDPTVLNSREGEQMKIFNTSFRPCLDFLGVEVPPNLVFGSQDYIRLLDRAGKARQSGECPQSLVDAP